MAKWKELPAEINGFKVILDLGLIRPEDLQPYRLCIAECKICQTHFKVRVRDLKKRIGCYCFKPLTPEIRINKRLILIKKGMLRRCYNKSCESYPRYGGRGITVCNEWKNTRKFCEWALANGYREDLTIDRIDNNKGYSPDNCRWATDDEQMQNSSKAKLNADIVLKIRMEHPELSYSKLASKYNVNKTTIACIIVRKTWRNI